jgi:hypothetical protein
MRDRVTRWQYHLGLIVGIALGGGIHAVAGWWGVGVCVAGLAIFWAYDHRAQSSDDA